MKIVALGLLVLSCAACSDPTSAVVIGAGGGAGNGGAGGEAGNGGAGNSAGNGGAGGGETTMGDGSVFPGTLAQYPLAVTNDGHAWLFSGKFVKTNPDNFGSWYNADLWKVDSQGQIEFHELIEESGFYLEPVAIHADSQGNVVILGHALRVPDAGSSVVIGGQTVHFPYEQSAFVAKLDSNGKLLWAHVVDKNAGLKPDGTQGDLYLSDVGMDDAGQVYVTANLFGTVDFGGGPVTHDDTVMFILSPQGDHVSDRLLPSENTVFTKLEVEKSGVTWLARSSFYSHFSVEKFAPAGGLLFGVSWPVCWVDAMSFALDGNDGFFAVRTEDVAEHCSSLTMQHDVPSGMANWLVEDGNYYAVRPAMARKSPGRAWMSIGLEGTITSGTSSLVGQTIDDILLAEIDDQGNMVQAATYGGPGVDQAVQMGLDGAGNRFMAGYFAESIDFGSGLLQNKTGDTRAIFLARLGK